MNRNELNEGDPAYGELLDELQNEFEHMSTDDLKVFIAEEYIAKAMKKDICTSLQHKHVWAVDKFKNAICGGCEQKVKKGLLCLKCLLTVHCQCYHLVGSCLFRYSYQESLYVLPHLFSNKTITGRCEDCRKPINQTNVGTMCRWCDSRIHLTCQSVHYDCTNVKFIRFLYPPIWRTRRMASSQHDPVLVMIESRPYDAHSQKLLREFYKILSPTQIINVCVTDPTEGFLRFSRIHGTKVVVIGGDKLCVEIFKRYEFIRSRVLRPPKFRFIPMDPLSEIGRAFSGRVDYSNKSAAFILEEIPTLREFELDTWEMVDEPYYRHVLQLKQPFFNYFALNFEHFLQVVCEVIEPGSFWFRLLRATIPNRWYNAYTRWRDFRRWGSHPEPRLDEYVQVEVDGRILDISSRNFVTLVILNRIQRQEEHQRRLTGDACTDGRVDVYGLTEYFNLTKKNIESKGIKLAVATNVKVSILKNCPYLTDGYSNYIRQFDSRHRREIFLRLGNSIQVLAVADPFVQSIVRNGPRNERAERRRFAKIEARRRQRALEMGLPIEQPLGERSAAARRLADARPLELRLQVGERVHQRRERLRERENSEESEAEDSQSAEGETQEPAEEEEIDDIEYEEEEEDIDDIEYEEEEEDIDDIEYEEEEEDEEVDDRQLAEEEIDIRQLAEGGEVDDRQLAEGGVSQEKEDEEKRKAQEAEERKEQERKEAEEREEQERKEAEERKEQERKEAEERKEQERKEAEERKEQERKEAEERKEQERKEAEKKEAAKKKRKRREPVFV